MAAPHAEAAAVPLRAALADAPCVRAAAGRVGGPGVLGGLGGGAADAAGAARVGRLRELHHEPVDAELFGAGPVPERQLPTRRGRRRGRAVAANDAAARARQAVAAEARAEAAEAGEQPGLLPPHAVQPGLLPPQGEPRPPALVLRYDRGPGRLPRPHVLEAKLLRVVYLVVGEGVHDDVLQVRVDRADIRQGLPPRLLVQHCNIGLRIAGKVDVEGLAADPLEPSCVEQQQCAVQLRADGAAVCP
mmetsp:Transcript_79972/g.226410  ORF Transcript_79972/g.226410 Transcript_79972/m.226410 type:complete len:246 (-) Transcript_79972:974-1711(-)